MQREKVTSIERILEGHNSGYEKHTTYRKNVRWSDEYPEDPKNIKRIYRRLHLQADQTEENVENVENLQIDIRRLRNILYLNERASFFLRVSSVSTKRISGAYLGYWIAATDDVLIPQLIVLIVVTLFKHVILVTLSPILQLLAGTVLPKTKLANVRFSKTKRFKTMG